MSDTSDEELMLRVASGADADAFQEIIDRWQKPIYYFVKKRVADSVDAEDITQEAFLRAFDSHATFDPSKGRFRDWIFTIAGNCIIDFHKKLKRVVGRTGKASQELAEALPEMFEGKQVGSGETIETIEAVLKKMPAVDAAIYRLVEYWEITTRELEGPFEMSQSAMSRRLQRVKGRLMVELHDYFFKDE